jgi:hypothetical protein
MVLEFWYKTLQFVVSQIKIVESRTYRYGWIVIVLLKKSEYVHGIVVAKLRYVVMVFEFHRRLVLCLFASIRTDS